MCGAGALYIKMVEQFEFKKFSTLWGKSRLNSKLTVLNSFRCFVGGTVDATPTFFIPLAKYVNSNYKQKISSDTSCGFGMMPQTFKMVSQNGDKIFYRKNQSWDFMEKCEGGVHVT